MKKRLILLTLGCAAIIFAFLHPSAILPIDKTNIDLPVTKEILDNGLTLLVKPIPYHPVVSIHACVRTGLSNEGEFAGTGISHFVEHMVFKGTEIRPAGAISKEVKSYGGYINASTGQDSTCFYIAVPKEYFQNALGLMADMVFDAQFDEGEFKKEKDVVLNEIRLRNDDPSSRAMRLLWSNSYMYHPYKYPVIGYEELFNELTRDDLVRYHATRYVPNNMVVGIAGDVDVNEAIAAARDIFQKYERKKAVDVVASSEPEQISGREASECLEINLGYIAMGFHTTSVLDKDLFATDVLSIVLGEGQDSRLYKTLVKDKELLHTVSSANYTPRYPGLFIIYGIGKPEKMDEAKKTILLEIEKLKNGPIDETELSRAKRMVLSSYLRSLETAQGEARSIARGELLTGDPNFSKRYVEGIRQVTGKKVIDAAGKYLTEDNITVATVLPKTEKAPLVSGEPPSISSMPEMAVLDNGIRIILKEDKRIPMVSLTCSFKGGLMAESKEDNGISNLTSAVLLKGTRSRREDEIAPALERLGASIGSFSGFNTFGVSMSFMKEDTARALDIFEDVVKNAAFPQDQIRKEKEKVFTAVMGEDDSIYSKGFLIFRKELFKEHPYGRRVIGEDATVEPIARDGLLSFYKKWRVPQNLVISAVGDLEKQALLSDLSKRFKGMKPVAEAPVFDVTPEPRPDQKREERLRMHKEQALVILGFQGTRIEDKDRYALSVLSSVLSGSDGRMHENIREALGAAYALGFHSRPGVDPGYVFFYVACSPKDVDTVIDKILEEIVKVRKESIETQELEDAKKQLIGTHRMSLQSNSTLASRMCTDELLGLGYAGYLEYEGMVSAVTKEDARKAALTYLNTDRYTLVVVTPFNDAT